MADFEYELITLGAGSGGVRAARLAGGYGAKVLIVEKSRVGGTCVMRGCVPKKLLAYASHMADDLQDARGYGWTIGDVAFNWPSLITAKNRELDRLEGVYDGLLERSGVKVVHGRGKIVGPHAVEVDGVTHTATRILIAVGGRPSLPSIPGVEHAITSDQALDLPTLPKEVVILGGGYIAVEFASIFNSLGSQTTLVVRRDDILRGFDSDVRLALNSSFERRGITIRRHTQIQRIEKGVDGRLTVHYNTGDAQTAEQVLCATGRAPNTADLGLEAAGVKVQADTGAIEVDMFSRTNVASIWAIGDVTNRLNLTPMAIREGACFAETEFNAIPMIPDHETVATAVFSQPPVAVVGLSEEQARNRGEVEIYRAQFRPMKNILPGRDEQTMIKLVVDRDSQVVLGAHMVGSDAPEIIQGIAIAVKAGLTKAAFDMTVGIHPTTAEEFVTLRGPLC